MTETLTIVGGSVASLATALLAAERGRRVDLYCDPPRLGGGFGGITIGSRRLDLGLRLFELDYEFAARDARPLDSFDREGDTHRPFIGPIATLIRRLLPGDLHLVPDPEMWINTSRIRCPLMTVDLAALPSALGTRDRERILQELHRLAPVSGGETMFETASRAQHGARLHALLVETLCAKQSPTWSATLAAYRRKLWMALFHPRTLIEAFSGLPIGFRPHRPFFATAEGGIAPLIHRLHAALAHAAGVTIHGNGPLTRLAGGPGNRVVLHFGANGAPVIAPSESTIIGVPPEPLFAAAAIPYAPSRQTASILWADVPERWINAPISTLLLCDSAMAPFRLSAAGRAPNGNQTFVVEFGAAAPSLDLAAAALRQAGVVHGSGPVTEVHRLTGPSQIDPTAANHRAFHRAWGQFRSCFPDVRVIGGARRFGWDSLNDHLLDALHFGATSC